MKYAIVCGSHRKDAQSLKVAHFIERLIAAQHPGATTYLFSLSKNPLPFWDEDMWSNNNEQWQQQWKPTAAEFTAADAIIVVTPEWSGMVPSGLKNFFLLFGNQELAHKPGLIVAVSAGMGGAYPVVELRISSYKNTRFCYIPEHVIVRNVQSMLNDPQQAASKDDEYIRHRLQYALGVLKVYGEALRHVRESGAIDHKTYPNGM